MPEHENGFEAVARSDRLLDALAAGAPVSTIDPLASLLAGWRDEIRSVPDVQVVSPAQAVAALAQAKQSRHHGRFGMTVIGAVAAALLCLGGFGAVVYGAGPGDALYGLRTMLFGESPVTRSDQVALAAQTELAQVQQLIQQGQWQQAQDKLAAISPTLQQVDNVQRQQQLVDQWNRLTVKVVERNPAATLPPGAQPPSLPGVPAPIAPLPGVIQGPTTTSAAPTTTSVPTTTTTPGSETATTTSPTPTTTSVPTTTASQPAQPPLPATTPTTSAAPPPASPRTATTTVTPTTTATPTTLPPSSSPSNEVTATTTAAQRNGQEPNSQTAGSSPAQAPAVAPQQQTSTESQQGGSPQQGGPQQGGSPQQGNNAHHGAQDRGSAFGVRGVPPTVTPTNDGG